MGGTFGPPRVITTIASGANAVYATDLDGDGDADALSASWIDSKTAWYENLMGPFDCNGDGIHDVCSSPNYCTAVPNTIGQPAAMFLSGSPLIADNNFTLIASRMPPGKFGYFIMANTQGFIPNVGGSAGNLCLGTPFYRFSKPPTGQMLNSGAGGTFSFTPDLGGLPQGVVFQIGDTWDFQAWFRDSQGGTSNFTDGIEAMFR